MRTLLAATAFLMLPVGSAPQEPVSTRVLDLGESRTWRAFDSRGQRYFVVEEQQRIRVLGPEGAERGAIDAAAIAALSPRADRILLFRRGQGFLWSVTLDSLTGTPLEEPRRLTIGDAAFATFAPDGREVAFARHGAEGSTLYALPASGGDERVVIRRPGRIVTPSWAPDGRWIWYVHQPIGAIARLERVAAEGGRPESLSAGRGLFVGFARGGRHYAISRRALDGPQDDQEVVVYSIAGDSIATINPPGNGTTTWSTLHPRRLISAGTETTERLRSLSYPEGGARNLRTLGGLSVDPRWLPDGSALLYLALVDGRMRLVRTDQRGTNPRVVPTSVTPRVGFRVSPDSRRVAFIAADGSALHELELATGVERRLDVEAGAIAWSSDSRAIRYRADRGGTRPIREWTPGKGDSLLRDVTAFAAAEPLHFVNDTLVAAGGNTGLRVLSLRSGATRTVAPGAGRVLGAWPLKVSRDGRWIGFNRADSATGFDRAYMMELATGRVHALGEPFRCGGTVMTWHPNGRDVFLYGNRDCAPGEGWNVFVTSIEGGPMRNLTTAERPGSVEHTAMHPDGTRLVYSVRGPTRSAIFATDLPQTGQPVRSR